MLNQRRVFFMVVFAGAMAVAPALLVPSPAVAQVGKQPQPKQPEFKPGTKFSAIKLIENDEYQKNIDLAIDAINDGDWDAACEYLQFILNSKEDFYAKVEVIDAST